MKKLMMITLCLLLTAGLMLSVSASEPKVVLASGAQFTPGSTLTVNIQAMTDMDARIYNAYLEGTVQYQWHSGNDPIPGATKVSYTIQSGDKSVFVVVTCDDLVLTSTRYLVTSAGIVVTRKTTTPTTVKPTTKTSTTKAPTVASTTLATGQDRRVAPSDAPVVTPSTDHTTVPTTIPAAIATTVPTVAPATAPTQEPATHASSSALENGAVQTPQESPTEQTAEEFPWWTVILVGAVAVAIIAVAAIATRKKK